MAVRRINGAPGVKQALADMSRRLERARTLRVGFLEGATYPDGTPVAAVAAFQDFGTRTIPPRPFFRNMVAAKSPEWPEAIGRALVANNYDAEKTLRVAGEAIAGQLRQSIVDTNEPPLAESTKARKGHDKPLIDTSQMINSVDFEVK